MPGRPGAGRHRRGTAVDDNREAWEAYFSDRTVENRNRLVELYIPLARMIGGKIARRGHALEYDDIVSYAYIGLIRAVERYDPSRGARFGTFAARHIAGAVHDGARGESWLPRTAVERKRKAAEAERRFREENGRPPSDGELAGALGLTEQKYRECWERDVRQEGFLSLDAPADSGDGLPLLGDVSTTAPSPEEECIREDEAAGVRRLLGALVGREPEAFLLVYGQGMTHREAAGLMGVSEPRVSQLVSAGRRRMKELAERTGL